MLRAAILTLAAALAGAADATQGGDG